MNYGSRYTQGKSKTELLDSKHKLRSHGKEMWTVLHISSVFLPEILTNEENESFSSYIKGILTFGTKFNKNWNESTIKYIEKNPFNFTSRENSMLWVCNFHNTINMELEKDLFECTKENITKRWGNDTYNTSSKINTTLSL